MKLSRYFKELHKQSVYISWILSYIVMTSIFIIASYGIYVGAKSILLDEIHAKNTYLLSQIQQNMDSIISDINNLGDEVLLNEDIAKFINSEINSENEFDGNRRFAVTKISNNLKRYMALYSAAADIFIYIPETDFVLSAKSSTDSKMFYSMYFKDTGLPFDKWKDIITSDEATYRPAIAQNDSGDNIPVIIFTRPLVSLSLQKTNSYLVMIIDNNSFINVFDRSFEKNYSSFYIIDANNQILCKNAAADTLLNTPNYNVFYKNSDIFKEKTNTYAYTTSNMTAWKFISIIPNDLIFNKLSHLLVIQIFCMFGAVVFAMLLIVYFTKRNYAPIAGIISIIQSEKDTSFTKYQDNEYEYIKKILSQTFSEQRSYSNRLEKQNEIIRRNYLQSLLHGSKNAAENFDYKAEALSIEFVSECFLVCVHYIDDCSELFFEERLDNDKNFEQAQFIIINIITELMNLNHVGYMIENDDMLVSIFNVDTENMNGIERIMNDIIEQAQKIAVENFNLHFSVASGSPCMGLSSLHSAYEEALAVMEYKVITCNTDNLTFHDMHQTTKYDYNYSNTLEQQLINSIKSGDFCASQKIVDEIFDINFKKSAPTLPFIQCLFFDITSTMIKSVSEISIIYKEEFINNFIALNNLIKCKTIDEFKDEIMAVLVKICDFIQSKNKMNEDKIEMQIANFVSEHYSESDLGIARIADYLNLSPNYVSALFKEKTGVGLLKYINKIRLDKALELLNDPNLKIKEIAERTGYINVRTFLSIFKKSMGITPTQYRDNNINL